MLSCHRQRTGLWPRVRDADVSGVDTGEEHELREGPPKSISYFLFPNVSANDIKPWEVPPKVPKFKGALWIGEVIPNWNCEHNPHALKIGFISVLSSRVVLYGFNCWEGKTRSPGLFFLHICCLHSFSESLALSEDIVRAQCFCTFYAQFLHLGSGHSFRAIW